jgi:hypothetical protein
MHRSQRVCHFVNAVVFCESVVHRLRFCLDHLYFVKMSAYQFYLQSRKQRKVGWVGDDSHVVFGKKKNPLMKNQV